MVRDRVCDHRMRELQQCGASAAEKHGEIAREPPRHRLRTVDPCARIGHAIDKRRERIFEIRAADDHVAIVNRSVQRAPPPQRAGWLRTRSGSARANSRSVTRAPAHPLHKLRSAVRTMLSTAGVTASASGDTDTLAPGAKAGPWVIDAHLGRGGMGAVYGVTHEDIGKRAALKVMHRALVSDVAAERILTEARVVNHIGHTNIVDIFETGQLPDGRLYIVMERLEGRPLGAFALEGKLLPDRVIAILLQICDALIAAHAAGVVHRDLKLDNVFLIENPDDPTMPKVKVLDWGIAKELANDVRQTIDGQLVGTPQYLSPAQARGLDVGPPSDGYSLGVLAYELFLEQLPFEAETAAEVMTMHLRALPPEPSELWPEIPHLLEKLLLQMLAKKPDQRPSMQTVAATLEQVRDELAARRQGFVTDPVVIQPRHQRARTSAPA